MQATTNNIWIITKLLIIGFALLLICIPSLAYADVDQQGPEKPMNQITVCDESDPTCDPAMTCGKSGGGDCGLFDKYINPLIVFLSGFVGIAVTIGIVWGGIQYASAGSDPSAIAKARTKIRNSLIALIVFLFTLALLNWLVPGGL